MKQTPNQIPVQMNLKPNDIKTDHTYQRPLDDKRIVTMSASLDLSRIGVPLVSKRSDGTYWAVDGQHRLELLRRVGRGDIASPVNVLTGLTLAQEARKFWDTNRRGPLGQIPATPLQSYKAELSFGGSLATDLSQITKDLGLRIASGTGARTINAVQTLMWVHQHNKNLPDVLYVLMHWAEEGAAFDRRLIKAMSIFLTNYPTVNLKILTNKLRPKATDAVIGTLRRVAYESESHRVAACSTFLSIYNRGLFRKQKLVPKARENLV